MKTHRILLDDFEGYEGEWVEIVDRRSYGIRNRVNDALGQGFLAFNRTRLALYVRTWSLPGDPQNEQVIDELDGEIATFIVESAETHYRRSLRTTEDRKSAGGEAGSSLEAPGVVPGA